MKYVAEIKKICFAGKGLLLAGGVIFLGLAGKTQAMHYTGSEIKSASDHDSLNGKPVPVTDLRINVTGEADPLFLTKIVLRKSARKKGRQAGEVAVYYTGNDSVFSTAKHFGSLVENGTVSPQVEQDLKNGANYFWLAGQGISTYKIQSFDLSTPAFRQVWADEFNGQTIDTANWGFERGFVRNEELQWYQAENASCKNGVLTIEARKEKKPNPHYVAESKDWRKNREYIHYTSSSMRTVGKQAWQYGRFEMRARIDTAKGYWPAWWTLGVSGRWPSNGESTSWNIIPVRYRPTLPWPTKIRRKRSGTARQSLCVLFLQAGKTAFTFGGWIGTRRASAFTWMMSC